MSIVRITVISPDTFTMAGCSTWRGTSCDSTFNVARLWTGSGSPFTKAWARFYCVAHVPAKWIRFFESIGWKG